MEVLKAASETSNGYNWGVKKKIPSRSLSSTTLSAVARVVDKCFSYKQKFEHIPSVAVGIVADGRVVFSKAYGYANVNRKVVAATDTLYRVASMSKFITAIAIMKLKESGRVDLNQKVSVYLPWFKSSVDPEVKNVTVIELLTHTAGIFRDGVSTDWQSDQFIASANLQEEIGEARLVYQRGSTWKYSNFGYAVLGALIESVCGIDYYTFVRKQILDPLNMLDTVLKPISKQVVATPYGREDQLGQRDQYHDVATSSYDSVAGFYTTIDDWLKLMSWFASGEGIICAASKGLMGKVHVQGNNKDDDGYGIALAIWDVKKNKIVGHAGGFTGYMSCFGMGPSNKVGVVVLTNAIGTWPRRLVDLVFHSIYCLDRTCEPDKKSKFSEYEINLRSRWGNVILIAVKDGLIAIDPAEDSPFGNSFLLKHLRKDDFFIESGSAYDYIGETCRFIRNTKGYITHVKWGSFTMERVAEY